jgi:hypothetical protein
MLPFFEEHKEYLIDWVTGSYEKEAAYLIQKMYPNIEEIVIKNDGVPGNLRDKEIFLQRYRDVLLHSNYDKVVTDPTVSFDLRLGGYKLKETYSIWDREEGDYICYHLDTISDWKRHTEIRDLRSDYKGYSFGKKGDFVLSGTKDCTELPFEEVAQMLCKSKLFVGIHSALACLNFYLNKPSVIIHPMPNLLTFGTYRKNFTELLKPTTEELREEIMRRLANE